MHGDQVLVPLHKTNRGLICCHLAGADTVRFKAEVNFDGREVARVHVNRVDREKLLKVGRNHFPLKSVCNHSIEDCMHPLFVYR